MGTIEQTYQKKTQLEHILIRPDTYIGSVEYTRMPMWVYDNEADKLVFREISYVPGLYKIFDEILVNAADNKQRDPKMKVIKVDINKEKNQVSVFNDGKGIPVVMHKVEKMYVPELIFGTLLTSSNYNDDEKKTTGGRNGYGAKLCNVFSKKFTVETSSKEYKRRFKQTWVNSMTKQDEAKIDSAEGEDFTKVTFSPDLQLFKMRELDDDIIALMSKRAYDVAGTTHGVTVYLNGKKLPVRGFKEYVDQYVKDMRTDDDKPVKVVFESHDRWEVALVTSETGNFQQVSFVNSINTIKGGTHVDLVANQVASNICEIVKKKQGKNSGLKVTNANVKNHMFLFVNALIENPAFDSQTKETLTTQAKSFGSKCDLGEKFFKEVQKSGLVEAVMSWVNFKQEKQKDRAGGKKTAKLKGIAKLEDANDAGTRNSRKCTLILTEGDSAKTLAVAGFGVVGRDLYGVFPLKGKLLNVREASHKQVMENQEIQNLVKILGLKYTSKYEQESDLDTLRYGKVMIMADQDQDGSHIKGLVINFIHSNWPNLLRKHKFIEEFITPIVKATKKGQEICFYSIPEYVEWRKNTDDWKSWKIKYYKGLGTSTSKEAKEYFSNMIRHRIPFRHGGEDDDENIVLAFSKKKIEERKVWLTKWMEQRKQRREQGQMEDYLYGKETRQITFSEFINKELVLFSNTDNERSIPSLVDGLKPGQRKVLFTCFKRADKKEIKVAQLAGAVGEMSAYHHGEASLMMTIVGLAQNFVGANNINYLLPIGQFGTRLQGGKDAASARYIFTQLNPVTRALFPANDDNVLRFLYEENQRIEPEWYCPIIPTVLVNGAEGIGTGWSTKVPNYNPRELVDNMRRLIRGEDFVEMKPWYKNFIGTITKNGDMKYECRGRISVIGDDTVEITELPIGTWTQKYKESVVEVFQDGTDKLPAKIIDYKEYHTDVTVHFIIRMKPEDLRKAEREGLHQFFKLVSSINTSNMVLFDAAGCLRKFESTEDICREFFECRRQVYKKRKQFLEGMLRAQSEQLSEKARFILMKINNQIHIENKRKANIVEQLISHKFAPDPVKKWKELQLKRELELCGEVNVESEDEEGENGAEGDKETTVLDKKVSDYDYLVGMAMWKLSMEDKDKLIAESNAKKSELEILERKEWSDLYEEDLLAFLAALDKQEEKERKDNSDGAKTGNKKMKLDARLQNAVRREPLFVETKEKTVAAKRAPKKEVDDSNSIIMDGEEKPKVKRTPKKATEAKEKKIPAKKRPKKGSSDEDESDFDDLSDAYSFKEDDEEKPKTKPPPKKTTTTTKTSKKENGAPAKKRPKKNASSDEDGLSDFIVDSDVSFEDDEEKPKAKAPSKKAATSAKASKKENGVPAKKQQKKNASSDEDELSASDDESDFSIDDDEEKPQKKRPRKMEFSDDDDDEEFDKPKKELIVLDGEEEKKQKKAPSKPKPAPKPKAPRAEKKKVATNGVSSEKRPRKGAVSDDEDELSDGPSTSSKEKTNGVARVTRGVKKTYKISDDEPDSETENLRAAYKKINSDDDWDISD